MTLVRKRCTLFASCVTLFAVFGKTATINLARFIISDLETHVT